MEATPRSSTPTMPTSGKKTSYKEPVESGDQKMLIAERVRQDIDTFYEDRHWSLAEVENTIDGYWFDPVQAEFWRKKAREAYKRGLLNDPWFRIPFINRTREQWGLERRTYGELTRIASVTPYSQSHKGYLPFKWWSPEFFLTAFESWGTGVICGNPDSGKTDLACTLMEMGGKLNYPVVTNILIPEAVRPSYITYTKSFKGMLITCIQNMLAGRTSLTFLDEVAQFWKKKRAMSQQYAIIEAITFLIRKVGANPVFIFQLHKDIPPTVNEFKDAVYDKITRQQLMYKYKGRVFKIRDVPPTNLKFQTHEQASFTVNDVDADAMREYIAALPEDVNQHEAMIRYLEMDKGEISEYEEKMALQVLLRKKASQRDIAKVWGVSQPAISKKIKNFGLEVSHEEEEVIA